MVPMITWEQFLAANNNSCGVRKKFEDLCRQLFMNEFLTENQETRYIHSNPNNPGIEADPVLQETTGKRLGYQVKYFDNGPGYDQILHSARKTVEYYNGNVDTVYLYSNKPLSTTAADYIKAEKLLTQNQIVLCPITGDSILDLVRKYPYLAVYYFGSHSVTSDWLCNYNNRMLEELGDRFNAKFNVDTQHTHQLSYFARDERAITLINEKKRALVEKIESLRVDCGYREYQEYLGHLSTAAIGIKDIGYYNMEDALLWANNATDMVKPDMEKLILEREYLESERIRLYSVDSKEDESTRAKLHECNKDIKCIDDLLGLPALLAFSELESRLISEKILFVTGDAGIGKSQLFANETAQLMAAKRDTLLLLAGTYCADETIQKQIMQNCALNFSFNDLLDVFEAAGEASGHTIPIFIDALNETWVKELWKTSVPALVEEVEKRRYIKLAISFRTEYSKQLLNPSWVEKLENGRICRIEHQGFRENSLEAIKEFFDYYGILFSPSEYLKQELMNPLFLTLYCCTYEGDEAGLPTLYNRILENANKKIHIGMANTLRALGYTNEEKLVRPFALELAGWMAERGTRHIGKEVFSQLEFWNEYKIPPRVFISRLAQEHILHNYAYEENEKWYFSYDQMNDYFCARAIIEKAESRDDARNKLRSTVLKIENGSVTNYGNRDLFIHSCVCYREYFGEECIDLIDEIEDSYEKNELFDRYIQSFIWRDKGTITGQEFLNLIHSRPVSRETVWEVLVGNSVKTEHPLNALFFHELLMSYSLGERDYIWTTYINSIFVDESNRLTQLVKMYECGKFLPTKSPMQTELLMILFGWLLTSSDRHLRDCTSKAMIEILKNNFDLCQIVLKKFDKVNDPYVFQRLYGIVFGACCKRVEVHNEAYRMLAEYVYEKIFDQDTVYPDILLRDYARLIIERYLWEYPNHGEAINREAIRPPYKSEPIPVVNEDYTKMECDGGMYRLYQSMKFEKMGMYGDFGRYTFQSALRTFDVDQVQIFNYAMQFIIHELNYKEEWFGEYDKACGKYNYNRHHTMKVERIGKKYQWIAMHNILARVSDHCEMRDLYSMDHEKKFIFEGPWEPYVRDFDPTLSCHFMSCEDAPIFGQFEKFISDTWEEDLRSDTGDKASQQMWLEYEGRYLNTLNNLMILSAEDGTQWVLMTNYLDTNRKLRKTKKHLVWHWAYAYYVTPDQEVTLRQRTEKDIDTGLSDLFAWNETYSVFNRNYPWAPDCQSFRESEWVDVEIGTKEMKTEIQKIPDYSEFKKYIDDLVNGMGEDIQGKPYEIRYLEKTVTREVEVRKSIGKVLHASSQFLWEEEYDASKQESLSWDVPCSILIEDQHLKQLRWDGFYYDCAGTLAAFDTRLIQNCGGLVVRKDILDNFLMKSGKKLIWLVNAGKEIYASENSLSCSSKWDGLLSYDGNNVHGKMYRTELSI